MRAVGRLIEVEESQFSSFVWVNAISPENCNVRNETHSDGHKIQKMPMMIAQLCRSLGCVATRSGIARVWTARSRTYSSHAARPGASAAFPPAERTIAGHRSAGSWCLPGFAVAASTVSRILTIKLVAGRCPGSHPHVQEILWVLSRCPGWVRPFLLYHSSFS